MLAAAVALVAVVPPEPAVRVRALLAQVRRPVLADLLLVQVPVLVQVHPEPVVRAQARVVLVQVVREPAVPLQRLLSRQSLSAAMARSSPSPGKPM
jgi:hypothetical protein